MASAGLRDLGRDLDRLFREGSFSGASDTRLLERFITDGDGPAFKALVARHRDMLLRTCHDLLGNADEADEAFQATIVILMRRASSIRERESIGGWLHRVACRVATRMRADAARRRASERMSVAKRALDVGPRRDTDPVARDELRVALHDEIDRLPERYRRPVILCLLEGMTQENAAARLGWTAGSVRGRLARGKARLRDRLTRRGIALTAVLAALAEPGSAAGARPFVAAFRWKVACLALSAFVAMGGELLAISGLADDTRKPAAKDADLQRVAASKAEPEIEALATFRGGGPTDQSRAKALPPEIAARPVDFRGRVVDPTGNGVAGARLSLITDAWSVPEQLAVSDDNGNFHFAKSVGDFWRNFAEGGSAVPRVQAVVLATHESFGAAWINLRVAAKDGKPAIGGEYPLALHMVADRPIEGRLIDGQGKPIAGALVWVDRLYAFPRGGLSPIVEALRKLDRKPYQTTYPRVWPNNLAAALAIPSVTTGADGRFTLRGVGRDRQANLTANGPGMASMSWTVLNRDEASEVTKAVRERWPHTPKAPGAVIAKAAAGQEAGVQVYGPTFELRVDSARTIAGVVREAMTGRPVPNTTVYVLSGGYSGLAKTDERGHYRIIGEGASKSLRLAVRPPDGSPLLPVSRELENVPASGEVAADFGLARAVVVSGRAVERGTGRPMLATQSYGCHGPGPIMAGHVWYRPIIGNASATNNDTADYFRYALEGQRGLYVGLVESDGVFRGVVPPGPGVLLLEAAPGMPFMFVFSLPSKESDGYHKRFPYAPLSRREPNDGAPHAAGEAGNTLPGTDGPVSLEGLVAYRVIEPGANDVAYKVDISIPAAAKRRVRFVDSNGQPVRGVTVNGLTASEYHPVILDGDGAEVLGLDAIRPRRLVALGPDGKRSVETEVRADSPEPITILMANPGAVTGRLADEKGNAVVGASALVRYLDSDALRIPTPRDPFKTDEQGRFRIDGIFPGHPVKIEFLLTGAQPGQGAHYRPDALSKVVLDAGQRRDLGTLKTKSEPW
jgi:RNA polymerase sigma factor (sigma-70 family)